MTHPVFLGFQIATSSRCANCRPKLVFKAAPVWPDPFAYERKPRHWAKIKAPVSDSRAAAVGGGKEGIRPILGNDMMETTLYFRTLSALGLVR